MFKRRVVLLDAWALQVKRDRISCNSLNRCERRITERRYPTGEVTAGRIDSKWKTCGLPVSYGLVEGVCRNRVAHSLCRRGRIDDTISATDHTFVGDAPGGAEASRKVVFVCVGEPASNTSFLRCYSSVGKKERVNPCLHFFRWNHEPAFPAAVSRTRRIEIHHQIVLVDEWSYQLVTQSEAKR